MEKSSIDVDCRSRQLSKPTDPARTLNQGAICLLDVMMDSACALRRVGRGRRQLERWVSDQSDDP
jgi:hypothetical protein